MSPPPTFFAFGLVAGAGFVLEMPFCGAPSCLILDRRMLGSKVRNMKMLIAVLAAGLTLAFVELGLGEGDAEAAAKLLQTSLQSLPRPLPGNGSEVLLALPVAISVLHLSRAVSRGPAVSCSGTARPS